jgi:hypothetical protein
MDRYVMPLAIPLAALLTGAVIVFAISRVLLSFSKEATPPVALAIAMVILIGSSLLAARVAK